MSNVATFSFTSRRVTYLGTVLSRDALIVGCTRVCPMQPAGIYCHRWKTTHTQFVKSRVTFWPDELHKISQRCIHQHYYLFSYRVPVEIYSGDIAHRILRTRFPRISGHFSVLHLMLWNPGLSIRQQSGSRIEPPSNVCRATFHELHVDIICPLKKRLNYRIFDELYVDELLQRFDPFHSMSMSRYTFE